MAARTGNAYTATDLRVVGRIGDAVSLCERVRDVLPRRPIVGVRAALVVPHDNALVILLTETLDSRFRSEPKVANTTELKGKQGEVAAYHELC